MTESIDTIDYILNVLNQRYGIKIHVDRVEDSFLLPRINKQTMTIRFNNRLYVLLKIYMLNNADLLFKYFLTHKYMSYHLYTDAEYWLEKTEIKAKKVLAKKNNCYNTNINQQSDDLELFQTLFVFLHEFSHGLFFQKGDVRKEYFDRIKDILEDLQECKNTKENIIDQIAKELHWGMRSFLLDQIGYGAITRNLQLIKEVSENERKIEEFACDLHAWQILASVLNYGGYSLEEQEIVFRYVIEALYYLENYKALDDCLSYKIDMNKAENVALFDSMRYSVLTYTIVLYLEGIIKGAGLKFDRYFTLFRWNERKEYIALINKFLPLTKSLENGSSLPNEEDSLSLYNRINCLEEIILKS